MVRVASPLTWEYHYDLRPYRGINSYNHIWLINKIHKTHVNQSRNVYESSLPCFPNVTLTTHWCVVKWFFDCSKPHWNKTVMTKFWNEQQWHRPVKICLKCNHQNREVRKRLKCAATCILKSCDNKPMGFKIMFHLFKPSHQLITHP